MIYVIYHQVKPGTDCPDGIAAAWVVRRHLRSLGMSGIEYVGRCYDDTRPIPEFRSGDEIYIVDFSFKASIVKGWMNQGCKVVIYDHHKTAEEEMQKLMDGSLSDHLKKGKSSIKFDMGESGATLAWKEMSGGIEPPEFLKHIKDRDLWNFDLDGTQEIHEAMGAMGRSFELFDALMADKSNTILYGLKNAGKRLLEPKRRAIAEACERAEWGEVAGYKGVLFVRLKPDGSEDRLTSDICSNLYKGRPDAIFVACFTSDRTWSLRSSKYGNNTDVGAIAKANGGGGHRNASGFKPTDCQ